MSSTPPNVGFLIDEDLSPELVEVATGRGFHAISVARMTRLRGRGDSVIARYAIDRDLVIVTNNLADFERLYANKEFHPGLVFICSDGSKLRTKRYQKLMMEQVLDEIEQDPPCQEAICITAYSAGRDVELRIDRYYLPEVASGKIEAA